MSYDISLVARVGKGKYATLAGYDNLNATYNLSPMFYRALPRGIPGLDGRRCGSVAIEIARAIQVMHEGEDDYRAMAPSNGWGTYEDAVRTMVYLEKWCSDCPDAIIRVS